MSAEWDVYDSITSFLVFIFVACVLMYVFFTAFRKFFADAPPTLTNLYITIMPVGSLDLVKTTTSEKRDTHSGSAASGELEPKRSTGCVITEVDERQKVTKKKSSKRRVRFSEYTGPKRSQPDTESDGATPQTFETRDRSMKYALSELQEENGPRSAVITEIDGETVASEIRARYGGFPGYVGYTSRIIQLDEIEVETTEPLSVITEIEEDAV